MLPACWRKRFRTSCTSHPDSQDLMVTEKQPTIDTDEIVDKKLQSNYIGDAVRSIDWRNMMKNLSRHRSALAFALLIGLVLGCKSTTSSTSSSTSGSNNNSLKTTNTSANTTSAPA